MNRVFLIGRIGNEPELKKFKGKKVKLVNIDLAINEEDKKTNWFRVVVFGKTAEIISKYYKKGRLILVEGRLQSREYEKDGIKQKMFEVLAFRVEPLSPNPIPEEEKPEKFFEDDKPVNAEKEFSGEQDEDIPF